jgi:hypothetical protein
MIPLFALADRGIGGLLRRSYVVGAVIVAAAGWWFANPMVTMACLMFLIWRTPGWDEFGGSTTPRSARQVVGAVLRNALPAAGMYAATTWFTGDPMDVLPFAGFCVVATGLQVWYAKKIDRLIAEGKSEDGQYNEIVELTRGAAYGVATALAALV